jgi:hypothetical protein
MTIMSGPVAKEFWPRITSSAGSGVIRLSSIGTPTAIVIAIQIGIQ